MGEQQEINKSVITIQGDILRYDINEVVDATEAARLKDKGIEALESGAVSNVFINMKQTHRLSSSARKEWVAFLQHKNIQRTAIVGVSVFMRTVASFVIAAANAENIKFFPTEEEALLWLSSQN